VVGVCVCSWWCCCERSTNFVVLQKECLRLQEALHDAESRVNGARTAAISSSVEADAALELRQQIHDLHEMNDSLRAQLRNTDVYRSVHTSPSRTTDYASTSNAVLSMDMDKKLDDSFADVETGAGSRNGRHQRSTFVPLVNSVRALPWPLRSSPMQAVANSMDSVFVFGASRPVLRTLAILASVLMSIHTFALIVIALSASEAQVVGMELHAGVVKPPPG
jgi:hypothetical protein